MKMWNNFWTILYGLLSKPFWYEKDNCRILSLCLALVQKDVICLQKYPIRNWNSLKHWDTLSNLKDLKRQKIVRNKGGSRYCGFTYIRYPKIALSKNFNSILIGLFIRCFVIRSPIRRTYLRTGNNEGNLYCQSYWTICWTISEVLSNSSMISQDSIGHLKILNLWFYIINFVKTKLTLLYTTRHPEQHIWISDIKLIWLFF